MHAEGNKREGRNGSITAISPRGVLIAAVEREAELIQGHCWHVLMAVTGHFRSLASKEKPRLLAGQNTDLFIA